MWAYLVKRVLLMIPTLFGIALIVFGIMVAAPGRPGAKAQAMGEVNATADPTKDKSQGESQRLFRRQFALDRPVFLNFWTGLDADDVLEAVRTFAAAPGAATVKARREAREQLEDWGYYAVPGLVDALGRTTGAEQDAVLYWLRFSATRLPVLAYGRRLDAETLARNEEWSQENIEIAKWTWPAGAAPEARLPVVGKWSEWRRANAARWQWSLLEKLRIALTDTQFGTYLGNLFRLDFGISHVHKRPVLDLILERLPITMTLSLISILLAYWLAVPLGILSAVRPYTTSDRVMTVGLFMLYSLPAFVSGTILLRLLTIGDPFQWFPNSGFRSQGADALGTWAQVRDVLWHITLPIVVSTYGGLASLSRFARSGMLDVIRSDYIRTARAKGLGEGSVILHHGARNGMMPVVTILGGILPGLIGGSVVIEYMFNINGMGLLTLEAIQNRDYNIVMTETLFAAALTLIGILLSDILYAVLDPRVTYK